MFVFVPELFKCNSKLLKTDNNKKKPFSYKSEANHQEKVTRETKEKTKETREKKTQRTLREKPGKFQKTAP